MVRRPRSDRLDDEPAHSLYHQPVDFYRFARIDGLVLESQHRPAGLRVEPLEALERVTEKWEGSYPNAMKSWHKNWDVISPIFKFSADVRKVIYTTNVIESLNSGYRRLNKQRSVFPSDTALLKALYLATHEIAKKWTMLLRRPSEKNSVKNQSTVVK